MNISARCLSLFDMFTNFSRERDTYPPCSERPHDEDFLNWLINFHSDYFENITIMKRNRWICMDEMNIISSSDVDKKCRMLNNILKMFRD